MSNKFLCLKISSYQKKFKSDKTISNRPATTRLKIVLTQKPFVMYFCNDKMDMINVHFQLKPFLFYLRITSFISNRAVRPYCAI